MENYILNFEDTITNEYLSNLEKQCNETNHEFILHGAMLEMIY